MPIPQKTIYQRFKTWISFPYEPKPLFYHYVFFNRTIWKSELKERKLLKKTDDSV